MAEPKWVLDKIVFAVHDRQIAEHGGSYGVRDKGLLASALARPKNMYHSRESKPSIAEVAASYAYGITRNHAFIDGNKRTAFVICRLFLELIPSCIMHYSLCNLTSATARRRLCAESQGFRRNPPGD